jgi:hypothetical protein
VTPEREAEIRALAARFVAPGSKHARIGAILVELLGALDDARARENDLAARLDAALRRSRR